MAHFASNPDGYSDSFGELNQLWSELDRLEQALSEFSENLPDFIEEEVDQTIDTLRAFEPSFCLIGPNGSGRATLINALIGQHGLLSTDDSRQPVVSPSLHLNARFRPSHTRALFRFFDRQDGDHTIANRDALGDDFGDLIGGSQAFPDLDPPTIQRFIYDAPMAGLQASESKPAYVDFTEFADLYIDLPNVPKGLCLRAPPDLTDGSTKAEQLTLKVITDSAISVLVLSAHQGLSDQDSALLRILCSLDPRDLVIFVNQIDELADPAGESRKIKATITKTLQRLGIDDGYQILFGSGSWANDALRNIADMEPARRRALAMLYGSDSNDLDKLRRRAIEASGLESLMKAVAERVAEGPGRSIVQDIRKRVATIVERSETLAHIALNGTSHSVKISERQLRANLFSATQSALNSFDQTTDVLRAQLRQRLEQDQQSFVRAALLALREHLRTEGGADNWIHDPAPLRLMMKASFAAACAKLRREGENAFDQVHDGALKVLEHDLGMRRLGSAVAFPKETLHKVPTPLARRLTLNLQGQWWRKYWRFGGFRAAERRCREVILKETNPLIDDLIAEVFDPAVVKTRSVIRAFGDSQTAFCLAVLAAAKDRATGSGSLGTQGSDTRNLLRLSA